MRCMLDDDDSGGMLNADEVTKYKKIAARALFSAQDRGDAEKLSTQAKASNTTRPETNSNDFGGFWNELADSNSNCRRGIFFNDSNL